MEEKLITHIMEAFTGVFPIVQLSDEDCAKIRAHIRDCIILSRRYDRGSIYFDTLPDKAVFDPKPNSIPLIVMQPKHETATERMLEIVKHKISIMPSKEKEQLGTILKNIQMDYVPTNSIVHIPSMSFDYETKSDAKKEKKKHLKFVSKNNFKQ